MATDCDRFARVLDKRFGPVAYALRTGENAVTLACDYIQRREAEANRELRPSFRDAFRDADRVLTRGAPLLIPDSPDPDAERIRQRGMLSEPARRLAQAFADVQNGACADLAEAYARRQARWMSGNIETYDEWSGLRGPFRAIEAAIVQEMTRRARKQYLNQDELTTSVVRRRDQGDITEDRIPAL